MAGRTKRTWMAVLAAAAAVVAVAVASDERARSG